MSSADYYLLLWTNLLLCGVNAFLDEYREATYFDFKINTGTPAGNAYLLTEFSFEEGVKYTVTCRRSSDWYLYWNVEPYGLKSPTFNGSYSDNRIMMAFKLHRDDQITIGCYSKSKKTFKEENKRTTFFFRTIKPRPSQFRYYTNDNLNKNRPDAEHKCYQRNNGEKCASLTFSRQSDLEFCNYDNIKSSNQDDNKKISENDNELSKNITNEWVPAAAGVAGVAVLLVVGFICLWFMRKRKPNQPIYAEPSTVYAEIQMESDGQLPSTENTPYAKIIGCISKKNLPKIKKPSENTENNRLGAVERINNLYSEIQHQ